MIGLYSNSKEYLLVTQYVTPSMIDELDKSIRGFVTINILPKLSKEKWFKGGMVVRRSNIVTNILISEHILTTEFTLMEETEEGYANICKKIKDTEHKDSFVVYF